MPYLLDTNVFIEAKDRYYGFDFCPAFWDWLLKTNEEGTVFSIEKVSDEIQAADDELSDWSSKRGSDFFLEPDETVLSSLGKVSEWATDQDYEPAAVSRFLEVADYYLVAHALARGYTVVTHEVPSNSRKKIKIPNACMGLNIKFMTPFQMLRIEQARFELTAP